jgi:glycosyltransferase involved in cell wall biosynthesis
MTPPDTPKQRTEQQRPVTHGQSTGRPSDSATPQIAIIIPILNEAATLGQCFDSLIRQDYPSERIELCIVDGGSTDNWQSHLQRLDDTGLRYQVLNNPKRSSPAAINLALQATQADYILWLSGHCVLAPNYLRTLTSAVAQHDDVIPGGHMQVEGGGLRGKLNAWVLQSPFGTGLAPWRHRRRSGWVTSATFALYNRRRLIELGGLDERLIRNQDNELVVRLRKAGLRYRLADTTATYLAPRTLMGLWRRAWANGSWTIWSWKIGFRVHAWYHLAPVIAALAGLLLAIMAIWFPVAGFALLGLAALYVLIAIMSAIAVMLRVRNLWAVLLLPPLFFIHHVFYALGEIAALFRPVPPVDSGARQTP